MKKWIAPVICFLWASGFAASCGTAAALGPAESATVQRSLWVDSAHVDLASPAVVNSLLGQPIQRLVVASFEDGQTIFPTRSGLFRQMSSYKVGPDALESVIAKAHARGIRVYASLDCLQWSKAGAASSRDIFLAHPDLAEIGPPGGCASPADGAYASPANAEVRAALMALAREMSGRYPRLDGVLLQCRLASGVLLGYSAADRIAYIRRTGIDPMDIALGEDPLPQDARIGLAWMKWRQDQVTDLLRGLAAAFRLGCPRAKIAVASSADWYRLTPLERNTSLDDWPLWESSGLVAEVALVGAWDEPAFQGVFATDVARSGGTKNGVPLTMVLRLSDGRSQLDPLLALEDQQGVPIRSLMLRIANHDDIARASDFWTGTLPAIEKVLATQF